MAIHLRLTLIRECELSIGYLMCIHVSTINIGEIDCLTMIL
jgi:hypothetical protein